MDKAECRTCKAEIIWIKTPAGKNHPIDAKPKKLWVFDGGGWQLEECHESHFASCPDAAQHRRG